MSEPYFGRPPARKDGRKRREAILDAALYCFFHQGLQQTGVEDIRKRADASPSSIYHHFGSLEQITLALLVRTFQRLFGHLDARTAGAPTAEALVTSLVDGHIEWVLEHKDEATFMYQALSLGLTAEDAEKLTEAKAEALAPVLARFMPFFMSGELPPRSPLHVEIVGMGPAHEACRRWLAGADLDPDWMRQELPAQAWRALQA